MAGHLGCATGVGGTRTPTSRLKRPTCRRYTTTPYANISVNISIFERDRASLPACIGRYPMSIEGSSEAHRCTTAAGGSASPRSDRVHARGADEKARSSGDTGPARTIRRRSSPRVTSAWGGRRADPNVGNSRADVSIERARPTSNAMMSRGRASGGAISGPPHLVFVPNRRGTVRRCSRHPGEFPKGVASPGTTLLRGRRESTRPVLMRRIAPRVSGGISAASAHNVGDAPPSRL